MPAAVCFICAAFSDFICNHNLSYHRYAEDLLLLYHFDLNGVSRFLLIALTEHRPSPPVSATVNSNSTVL